MEDCLEATDSRDTKTLQTPRFVQYQLIQELSVNLGVPRRSSLLMLKCTSAFSKSRSTPICPIARLHSSLDALEP